MNLYQMARASVCVVVLVVAALQTACVGAMQQYRLVDLGVLECEGGSPTDPDCSVGDLNDWCEVAGFDKTPAGLQNAHVWRPAQAGSPLIKLTLGPPQYDYNPIFTVLFAETPQPSVWVPRSGAASTGHHAYDINNFGYVAGRGGGPRVAPIIWATRSGPSPSGLGRFPSMYLVWPFNQFAIDSAVQAIAAADNLSEPQRTVARNMALQTLATSAKAGLNGAYAINDEYQVAGNGTFSTGPHAFVFRLRSGVLDLGALPNSSNSTSEAWGIGEGGEVVGFSFNANSRTHAFYWDQSMGGAPLRDLGSLSTGATDSSRAHAVNRWGVVVGESGVQGGSHAFRWDATSGLQSLGDLPGGAPQSIAYAIRDAERGDIVGRGTIAIGPGVLAGGMRAVGWPGPSSPSMPNGAPIDLNTRIVPPDPNVTLIEAKGINKLGIISAKGISQGIAHVYILVPREADMPGATGVTPYQERCLGPFTQ